MASSSNPPPPAERASEIINQLPSSPNLITKTGTAVLGTGLLATAISQELYVFNEETVLLIGSLILFTYLGKVCVVVLFIVNQLQQSISIILTVTCRSSGSPTVNGLRPKSSVSRRSLTALAPNTHKQSRTASHLLEK